MRFVPPIAVLALAGCSTTLPDVGAAMRAGDYGAARLALREDLRHDRGRRDYILDRLRLTIASLADGHARSAEDAANEMWDLLRTQGLNEDRTVAAAVFVEDVRIWKGEPFEQALAYHYIALQKAMRGEWDNARAAADQSLFLLKDFGENEFGARMTTEQIAREAVRRERAGEPGWLDHGYQPVKTDFALGYLMNGLANWALGREEEAADNFREAVELDAGLGDVAERVAAGGANTVLVVDYGLGPEKVRYGMDGAFTRFRPRVPSAGRRLHAAVEGGDEITVGPACDVNAMAADHMWNGLRNVRVAKSRLGTALLYGGAAVAASSRNRDTAWAGLGMMLVGALMKVTSRATVDYCDLLPQSVYVAPLYVAGPDATIRVRVGADRRSEIALAGVDPPPPTQRLQLLFARIPPDGAARSWETSGDVLYLNDHYDGPVDGPRLPWILGGRCVRTPSQAVLEDYQRAGWLPGMTLGELESLYHAEGIALETQAQDGFAGRHVLEGGTSLVAPQPGTAGYARLFGQMHPPYRPRSPQGRALYVEPAGE